LFLPPFVVWTIHVVAAVEVRIACHDFVFAVVVAVETFAADVAVDNNDDDDDNNNSDNDDNDDDVIEKHHMNYVNELSRIAFRGSTCHEYN
jgi:hypothetical protein